MNLNIFVDKTGFNVDQLYLQDSPELFLPS